MQLCNGYTCLHDPQKLDTLNVQKIKFDLLLQAVSRQLALSCLSLCTLLFKAGSKPSICHTPVQAGDQAFSTHSR